MQYLVEEQDIPNSLYRHHCRWDFGIYKAYCSSVPGTKGKTKIEML
jgi:hypothetical protein